jgi:hypothetical protein
MAAYTEIGLKYRTKINVQEANNIINEHWELSLTAHCQFKWHSWRTGTQNSTVCKMPSKVTVDAELMQKESSRTYCVKNISVVLVVTTFSKSTAIPVTDRGCLWGCEMLRIPHCLDQCFPTCGQRTPGGPRVSLFSLNCILSCCSYLGYLQCISLALKAHALRKI